MSKPLVSIGLPVYNGENFVAEALECLLGQTYDHLEVVIGDNASTDGTEKICRTFARGDRRVRYTRHAENLGASDNHDFVFFESTGPLFKLAAHDDLVALDFVERCVEVLTQRPEVVLAFSRARNIDAAGLEGEAIDEHIHNMGSARPAARFGHITCRLNWATPVFGVFRREAVRSSTILERYVGSDRQLLAELALAGPWHRIDDYLFYRRDHATNSTKTFARERDRIAWFDPTPAGGAVRFPHWRRLAGFVEVIERADLAPLERLAAHAQLGRWMVTPWHRPRLVRLARDLVTAGVAWARAGRST